MSATTAQYKQEHPPVRLGEIASTAIAGNDILSSCLYVCGIASLFAGVWAPLVFLVIGLILYFYKHVYTEVVREYAKRYRITRNNVFVGSIHHTHDFSFEDLGGVRVIQ